MLHSDHLFDVALPRIPHRCVRSVLRAPEHRANSSVASKVENRARSLMDGQTVINEQSVTSSGFTLERLGQLDPRMSVLDNDFDEVRPPLQCWKRWSWPDRTCFRTCVCRAGDLTCSAVLCTPCSVASYFRSSIGSVTSRATLKLLNTQAALDAEAAMEAEPTGDADAVENDIVNNQADREAEVRNACTVMPASTADCSIKHDTCGTGQPGWLSCQSHASILSCLVRRPARRQRLCSCGLEAVNVQRD